MESPDRESIFRKRVYGIVAMIPRGRVVTYGQVALLAGLPRAAREVGWVAHTGPSGLPWQRVINRFGGLAKGYPGGQLGHKIDLEKDGIKVSPEMVVDLAKYQWWPDRTTMRGLHLPPELTEEINRKIAFSRDYLDPKHRRQSTINK